MQHKHKLLGHTQSRSWLEHLQQPQIKGTSARFNQWQPLLASVPRKKKVRQVRGHEDNSRPERQSLSDQQELRKAQLMSLVEDEDPVAVKGKLRSLAVQPVEHEPRRGHGSVRAKGQAVH